MKKLKTVPFAEYLDDVRNNTTERNYLGFISRDGRLVSYGGISDTNIPEYDLFAIYMEEI